MGITIEGLSVSYGGETGHRVIDGLTLGIDRGSFFTLLGPSGCGKTTLLRSIAGFVPIETGTLKFGPRDVTHLPAYRRNIGMVFQDYALFPDKTVFDNVAYGLRARKEDEGVIRRKVSDALDRVGLGTFAKRHPAALSGGQRQRVALMRALVIGPDVLLMDEPLSNLDAKLRQQVRETIMQLQREAGITTIFVTHDQDEALAMSDRIGVMNKGRLEQIGTPAEIYRIPTSAYVADFIGAANLLEISTPHHQNTSELLPLEIEGGTINARVLQPLRGGPAYLVIRPEDVRISRAGPEASGTLGGRIARRQYLGSKTSYKVALRSGATIAVDLYGEGHDAFAADDTVHLIFDPFKTLVLPS